LEKLLLQFINREIEVRHQLLEEDFVTNLSCIFNHVITKLRNGSQIAFCGNGGSSTFASHMTAEFVGRYKKEKPSGLKAVSLNDIANITAIGNDYGYKLIYAKQVEALLHEGDVLFGFSTSGSSENIVEAVKAAKKRGILTISMTGETGGELKGLSDYCICVPSKETAIIQSCHLTIGHLLCEVVDRELF